MEIGFKDDTVFVHVPLKKKKKAFGPLHWSTTYFRGCIKHFRKQEYTLTQASMFLGIPGQVKGILH